MATFADALAECLEAVRTGGDLEECLERYPRFRAKLLLLLDVVAKIEPFPPLETTVRPSEEDVEELVARLRQAAEALPRRGVRGRSRRRN